MLAFLVIYHEIRDFELDPRDKNFCSVTSHEPLKIRDFGKFPKKLGKSSNFAQKVVISVTKNQKINSDQNFFRDFSTILRSFARDFRDFWGVFWLEIFVIFGLKSRDFQEKSSANTDCSYLLDNRNQQFSDGNQGDGNPKVLFVFMVPD